ncbi:MAG TPA: MBL fold metallo-hydrolase [Woeseiaceae bacterium]|nr:MBL fold metallo-hydrolase [Woeseiaceae bacterium]
MTAFSSKLPHYKELAAGVRRLLAPNPSMMTGPGTNTYLFGVRDIAVLDPGPHLVPHLDDIVRLADGPIRWILATHTHPDHSPGVKYLAAATGAEVLGMPAPRGEHQDMTFQPTRILRHGDRLETDEFVLEAVHTPGHASNHLCYRMPGKNWVFTGDHVIDGSTVVINPPDGNMQDYLDSLVHLRALRPAALLPGHGDLIDDPSRVIDWIVQHRLAREAKVLAAVEEYAGLTTMELVPRVYQDVAPALYTWAERSLLAHLIKLANDGRVREVDGLWSVHP